MQRYIFGWLETRSSGQELTRGRMRVKIRKRYYHPLLRRRQISSLLKIGCREEISGRRSRCYIKRRGDHNGLEMAGYRELKRSLSQAQADGHSGVIRVSSKQRPSEKPHVLSARITSRVQVPFYVYMTAVLSIRVGNFGATLSATTHAPAFSGRRQTFLFRLCPGQRLGDHTTTEWIRDDFPNQYSRESSSSMRRQLDKDILHNIGL